jgi:hypothetical protein
MHRRFNRPESELGGNLRLQPVVPSQTILDFGHVQVYEEIILVCVRKPFAGGFHPERAFNLDRSIPRTRLDQEKISA